MMFSKLNFTVFGQRVNLAMKISKERSEWIAGIGNRCADGNYVIFLDYDNVPYDYIIEELKTLSEKYCLGNGYIFKTGNGFHVVFLEKFCLGNLLDIMNHTACDKSYIDVPLMYGRKVWVLRQTQKGGKDILYFAKFHSKFDGGIKSRAHAKFLKKRYNIKINIKGYAFDTCDKLTFASYFVKQE